MSDTPAPETDEINLLLENLDEWIDDSLQNSKPIGLTLCSARRTIVSQRARITELWDALGMVRRQRDRMDEELNDAWKERDEARKGRDHALKSREAVWNSWNEALEQRDAARRDRDEAREELTRVRKELAASNRGAKTNAGVNKLLCARLTEAERERDEARRERDELLQRLSVWESAASRMRKQLSFAPPFHQGMDSQEEAQDDC